MCYSEFGDIFQAISDLDADVISIENARSGLELLETFREHGYDKGIGPGVYDIHSPRVPPAEEIAANLRQTLTVLDAKPGLGQSGLRPEDPQAGGIDGRLAEHGGGRARGAGRHQQRDGLAAPSSRPWIERPDPDGMPSGSGRFALLPFALHIDTVLHLRKRPTRGRRPLWPRRR